MKNSPIFQSIFGEQWSQLPPVMHKHYANRTYTKDVVTVKGIMKMELSPFMKLLSPLLRLTGALVPYAGENVPVTVHYRSEENTNHFCLDRIFHFPGKSPYHFRSRMQPVGNDEIIEFMRSGIGWRAQYRYNGHKVILSHRGYVIKLFGKIIPVPLAFLIGKGHAQEEALDDNSFQMYMSMRHLFFGKLYAYSGKFLVTEIMLDKNS